MRKNYFNFKLGNFECVSILDTVDPMQFDFIFPGIPASDISNLLVQYNIPKESNFEITALFIKTPKHNILIDTGLPTKIRPNAGMLIDNLLSAGIQPQEIDTVILSHGHPDHIGGNINAKQEPTFPNAVYVINKKEWEFWAFEPDLKPVDDKIRQEMLACVHKYLFSIKDRIIQKEAGIDIIPGIQYVNAPGHTPGHAGLLISSGAEQLIYVADSFHNTLQLARPDWSTPFDLSPKQAAISRVQLINRALSTNAKIFASHFPFPAIGRIVKNNDVYLWQPIRV